MVCIDDKDGQQVMRIDRSIKLYPENTEILKCSKCGAEFACREEFETASDGSQRTTVYYCDPYSFWQKGCCEKNHEYIRYVRKKGSSFDDLEQSDIDLLANHINSTKRDSLNGHSPYELSRLLLDERLLTVMNYKAIAPDDVNLTPGLLK